MTGSFPPIPGADKGNIPSPIAKAIVPPSGDTSGATDYANITSALATYGAAYLLPYGTYWVAQPISITRSGAQLTSTYALPMYPNTASIAVMPVITATAAFSGSAIVTIDAVATPGLSDVTVRGLAISGASLSGGTTGGILVNGAPVNTVLEDVITSHTPGTGITYTAPGSTPASVYFHRVISWFAGIHGFDLRLQDSLVSECMAMSATQNGWMIRSVNDTVFTGCRAEHNGQCGYFLTLSAATSTITFSACTTDQNNQDGFRVDTCSGNGPVQVTGCSFRRDGNNAGAGSTTYAGITVSASTLPVIVTGTNVAAMKGDTAGYGPYYGVKVASSSFVTVTGGYVSSTSSGQPYNWDGSGVFQVSPGVLTGSNNQSGFPGTTTTSAVAESTGAPTPPAANGMIAWSTDGWNAQTSSSVGTAGTLYLNAVYVASPAVTSKVWLMNNSTLGSTGSGAVAGESFAGLYSSAGALVASVGIDAFIGVVGAQSFTWTIPAVLQPGMYWVAVLINAATMPQLLRVTTATQSALNANLTAATFRTCTNGTLLTALPSTITPASNSQSAPQAYWVAIS